MRKGFLILLMLPILALGSIYVLPSATIVEEGSSVSVLVELTDEGGNPVKGVVSVDMEAGGFEEIELIYGMEINGEATVHYIAPLNPGDYTVKFLHESEVSTVVFHVVSEEEGVGEEATAQVVDFRGSVAYKEAGSEIWKSMEIGTVLKEGYSILTIGDSYAVIRFPNGAETRVLEDTQLEIVKLAKVESGYVIKLKQYKGKTYNVVERMLRSGEKFYVETDTVTAGVRGTKFAVVETEEGFEIDTFEGKVYAYMKDGRVLVVPAGMRVTPNGKLEKSERKEEEFGSRKMIKEGKREAEKEREKEGKLEETQKSKPTIEPGGMYVGSLSTRDGNFLVYSFGINFDLGIVGFDLGITAYSTEVGGQLFYGLPSSTPSTNVLDAITLNAIKLRLGSFSMRYGSGGNYTLGMGYTMRNYTVPHSRTLDLKFKTDEYWIFLHLPYELKKLSSFEIGQTDDLFFGGAGTKIMGFEFSLAVVYNSSNATSAEVDPVRYALILSALKKYSFLSLGVEGSTLVGRNGNVALGAFGGLYGKLLIFDLVAGPYVNFGGFEPVIFSEGYSPEVDGVKPDGGFEAGYLVGAEFKERWGSGRIYLHGSFNSQPVLDGYLSTYLPRIGTVPPLELSGWIYDPTPLEGVWDEDTTAWFAVATVVGDGLMKTGMKFIWDGEKWKSEMFVTGGGI